ncbi:protein O-mannosyl-transferase family [Solitalea lacus]|uniref:protein O-mannosyl-transferase family n=1 Tax=Solitalea lacus TaxID=2911172 RepID=UPI001EDB7485|nr:DUF2723 domain-containing protein [Solitalea lacus]UKJ07132.1 DUF2723 domain-containing protein [Solitalea lacus]
MAIYSKLNNLFGWLCFIIATTVYTLTLEPTVSFWDCGEFIASVYRLQVCHQPGAPLFLMVSKLLSLFSSDNTQIAWWVNFGSALASGATVMFLFWTITHLAKKLLKVDQQLSLSAYITVFGAGITGALAYAFSDTFWFSAVEAEAYALSSLFTAVTFWAVLKWENESDQPRVDRWLLFIAYLIGLSIGVHLLNLLAIPAIGMVYYFKKINKGWKGALLSFVISCGILILVQYGIIPGTVSLAASFDLFFVNSLSLPFNSGVIAFILLLIGLLVFGLYYSTKRQKAWLNTTLLCLSFIYIGYTSYGLIIIRAKADPSLNNTSPDNVYSFLSYLNREQFGAGDALLYGPHFASKQYYNQTKTNIYTKGDSKYEVIGKKMEAKVASGQGMVFPRVSNPDHERFYRSWLNRTSGNPTFSDNIEFFTTYQLGHMYWRYFMWNFAGRQNNIQGEGEPIKGNWLSGIKQIDAIRLGDQSCLPPSITQNEAYNRLYFLPLLLGLFGLFYQLKRNSKDFVATSLLFVFTGIAIIVYLNQTPNQVRDRDYAYAASFYAFTIWIGLGVLAVKEFLTKRWDNSFTATLSTTICVLAVPVLMLNQEWDDHDRSQRTIARDIAKNTLDTCAPNAILFVAGDNDTFPLWYMQEVEHYRSDVRIVNLQLLGMGWYGKQLLKPVNKAAEVKLSYTYKQFANSAHDYTPFLNQQISEAVELKELLDFIGSDDIQAKVQLDSGDLVNYLPATKIKLSINKEKMLANASLSKDDEGKIENQMVWSLPEVPLMKNQLLMLNIIANNINDRPIYFHQFLGSEEFCGIDAYFQKEGLVYRVVPIKDDGSVHGIAEKGRVNTNVLYDNLMNKYEWGNINNKTTYIDPTFARNAGWYRDTYNTLAKALLKESKLEDCEKVLDKMEQILPITNTGIGLMQFTRLDTSGLYYNCKAIKKANAIVQDTSEYISKELNHLYAIKPKYSQSTVNEVQTGLYLLQSLAEQAKAFNQIELSRKIEIRLSEFIEKFEITT